MAILCLDQLDQSVCRVCQRWCCVGAEFNGERIVEGHMDRIGGREQLLQQMYSALATKREDSVDLALRCYGVEFHHPHYCPAV